MEYVYAAMLLHKAGKKVDEAHMKKVLEATGVKADASRIKALVAALDGVNIDEAVEKAAVAAPVAAPAATPVSAAKGEEAPAQAEAKKEEVKEKKEEEAAAGLGALFG